MEVVKPISKEIPRNLLGRERAKKTVIVWTAIQRVGITFHSSSWLVPFIMLIVDSEWMGNVMLLNHLMSTSGSVSNNHYWQNPPWAFFLWRCDTYVMKDLCFWKIQNIQAGLEEKILEGLKLVEFDIKKVEESQSLEVS